MDLTGPDVTPLLHFYLWSSTIQVGTYNTYEPTGKLAVLEAVY
jgi:hypothetical protein